MMYRIGMFSKINKLTVKTLRFYDQAGLLKPAFIDPENGYRYYTSDQLPALHRIISLRQIGFSIDEILAILSGREMDGIFERRKRELEANIDECRQQLLQISHYLDRIKEEFPMAYQVVLKELPEVIVFSKRMKVPNYDAYFELIPQIGEEMKRTNPDVKCLVPEYCFIIYHDSEYRERDINVEFCEAVTASGRDTETIKFKQISRVPLAACAFHKGPYRTIGNAYAYVFKWMEDNGYLLADSPRESYIDGIWNKDDEKDWLTELQVPVMKKQI